MFDEVNFLLANYRPYHRFETSKHYNDHYSLKLMTQGNVELWYDQKRYDLEGAWFFTGYPGPFTRFHPARGHDHWEHRYVVFRGPLIKRLKTAKLWFETPQRVAEGKDYVALFDELIDQSRRSDRWGKILGANLLERILIELAEDRAQALAQEPWLERVLNELHNQDSFNPNYQRVAAACNMSMSTLRRRFKQAMGLSVHSYVMQRRMASARDLLITTNLSINAIAEHLGYKDAYYFSIQFHRQVGMPPTLYRRHLHVSGT